jgi:hypothetical protein
MRLVIVSNAKVARAVTYIRSRPEEGYVGRR